MGRVSRVVWRKCLRVLMCKGLLQGYDSAIALRCGLTFCFVFAVAYGGLLGS